MRSIQSVKRSLINVEGFSDTVWAFSLRQFTLSLAFKFNTLKKLGSVYKTTFVLSSTYLNEKIFDFCSISTRVQQTFRLKKSVIGLLRRLNKIGTTADQQSQCQDSLHFRRWPYNRRLCSRAFTQLQNYHLPRSQFRELRRDMKL